MSTDLLSCLQAQKWHTLRGLARANNLPFDSNLTAAQAAKHLQANLGQDNFFPTLWPALSSEAQAALLALQEAGGDIELVDIDQAGGKVSIRFQGACRGCPMAEMTLKMGVERRLKERVPEVKRVEPVATP